MTKIKLCGLTRMQDIAYANELMPDYIGFVFAPKSKRYVSFADAEELRKGLDENIVPVGVFADERIFNIEYLAERGIIAAVQLHGHEDNGYIRDLRRTVKCPVIQAFRIESGGDIKRAEQSEADHILLDSGGGTGRPFDHSVIGKIKRDFFLAGGLDSRNVREAIEKYRPYAVDASSSLETDGVKDREKMAAFVRAVRYGKDEAK